MIGAASTFPNCRDFTGHAPVPRSLDSVRHRPRLAVSGGLARAQGYDAALAGFANDSFGDTETAINAVAASGNPLAAERDRSLAGRTPAVRSRRQEGLHPADHPARSSTPRAAGLIGGLAPAGLKAVRLNNRLRRAIDAAIGALTLLSADPAKRYDAAQAVFKSRDADALKTLDAAIAKETDVRIKRALTEARAAIILNLPDASIADKLDAVSVIRERGDQDARGLLAGLAGEERRNR